MQLKQKENADKASSSLIGGIRRILANEGIGGLYGGIFTKVTQSAITSAFLFLFKEQLYAVALIVLGAIRNMRRRKAIV